MSDASDKSPRFLISIKSPLVTPCMMPALRERGCEWGYCFLIFSGANLRHVAFTLARSVIGPVGVMR